MKLFALLKKDYEEQLCYYQVCTLNDSINVTNSSPFERRPELEPTLSRASFRHCSSGVQRCSTLPLPGQSSSYPLSLTHVLTDSDRYLDTHVTDGYKFLMQNYRIGDKICIFGAPFSF